MSRKNNRTILSFNLTSKPLTPDSEGFKLLVKELNMEESDTIEDIAQMFSEGGWDFEFKGNQIVGFTSMEMANEPASLKAIASIFEPGSWIRWEESGTRHYAHFTPKGLLLFTETKRLFPAEAFSGEALQREIEEAREYLSALVIHSRGFKKGDIVKVISNFRAPGQVYYDECEAMIGQVCEVKYVSENEGVVVYTPDKSTWYTFGYEDLIAL